jgi:hypothetical protein
LRELNSTTAETNVILFRPALTYRIRPGYDQATPTPKDEPQSDNPPTGAILDYYLKEAPTAPIRLEIFDEQGSLVRSFASNNELFHTKPETVQFTPDWIENSKPLRAEAGMHRFVWDLRTALPQAMHPPNYPRSGALVVPGSYTVKLTVNGATKTQPLVVKMDPRIQISPAALQKQFALASHLNGRNGEVAAAILQANELKAQIAARSAKATGNTRLLEWMAALQMEIDTEVKGEEDGGFELLSLPNKDLEPLHRTTNALNSLAAIVENADAAPNEDVITAAAQWEDAATKALARWQGLLRQRLAQLNEQLRKEHLESLNPH